MYVTLGFYWPVICPRTLTAYYCKYFGDGQMGLVMIAFSTSRHYLTNITYTVAQNIAISPTKLEKNKNFICDPCTVTLVSSVHPVKYVTHDGCHLTSMQSISNCTSCAVTIRIVFLSIVIGGNFTQFTNTINCLHIGCAHACTVEGPSPTLD